MLLITGFDISNFYTNSRVRAIIVLVTMHLYVVTQLS